MFHSPCLPSLYSYRKRVTAIFPPDCLSPTVLTFVRLRCILFSTTMFCSGSYKRFLSRILFSKLSGVCLISSTFINNGKGLVRLRVKNADFGSESCCAVRLLSNVVTAGNLYTGFWVSLEIQYTMRIRRSSRMTLCSSVKS